MFLSNKKDAGVSKVVAIYPYCDVRFGSPIVPAQIHIGTADEWTPSYLCKNVFGFFRPSPLGQVFMYEDAHHGYDFFVNTDSKMWAASTGNVTAWRTQRSDPVARDLSIDRVIEFFKN